MNGLRAVVDCGTNSTRLWLQPDPAVAPVRRARVTRLGRGVDATGRFDDDALAATLAVVDEYAAEWTRAGIGADEVAIIATSAVRDAADRQRYVDGVQRRTGVMPVVLSGGHEARASFVGATSSLASDVRGPVVVVDIGGGSTELVTGRPDAPGELRAVSTQLGTVRLTERHLHDDPPSDHQVATARHAAASILVDGIERIGLLDHSGRVEVVAVAGTATALAALDTGSDDLDDLHGHVLTADRVRALAAELAARSAARRMDMGPLAPGRADVIAGGAIIMAEVLALLGRRHVTVSVADVLDGVAQLWPVLDAGG